MTQGKTYSNNEQCCAAAHATDRNFATISASDTGGLWLMLKFDRRFFISKIIIYYQFYTNWFSDSWCVQTEENFRSCAKSHSNVDVSVYQGDVKQKSCGTLQLTYGLKQSNQIYTLICNTEGDTVKLSKSTGFILVSEVVVISQGKTTIIFKKLSEPSTMIIVGLQPFNSRTTYNLNPCPNSQTMKPIRHPTPHLEDLCD